MTRLAELAANQASVERRITAACAAAGRARADLTLVAVSKTWPVTDVALLAELGVRDFGENRDREAAAKAREFPAVRWHFVGAVQTNKAASIASYADVVHAVDRLSLVGALATGARRAGREVAALVQVSLDGDPARGGVLPAGALAVAGAVDAADGLRLGGVMAIAPLGADPDVAFGRLAEVAALVRQSYPAATVVSAGMSGDLEAAIAAGATVLRVGTALFGHRRSALG